MRLETSVRLHAVEQWDRVASMASREHAVAATRQVEGTKDAV